MPTAHLAGTQVVIGKYAIQRCLLCGAVLDEFDFSTLMVADGSSSKLPFQVGAFYEFDRNMSVLISESESPIFESDLDIPDNCCIRSRLRNEANDESEGD